MADASHSPYYQEELIVDDAAQQTRGERPPILRRQEGSDPSQETRSTQAKDNGATSRLKRCQSSPKTSRTAAPVRRLKRRQTSQKQSGKAKHDWRTGDTVEAGAKLGESFRQLGLEVLPWMAERVAHSANDNTLADVFAAARFRMKDRSSDGISSKVPSSQEESLRALERMMQRTTDSDAHDRPDLGRLD